MSDYGYFLSIYPDEASIQSCPSTHYHDGRTWFCTLEIGHSEEYHMTVGAYGVVLAMWKDQGKA